MSGAPPKLGRLVARGLAWVLRGLGTGSAPRAAVRSLLVIRVDERVGNVLLTLPLVERLRQCFPEAQVDFLVAASKQKVARGSARVLPFEKRDAFRRPLRLWALLWRLRRARYDVVIDASHWHSFSLTSALLLGWSGAPRRVAHERGEARRFANLLAAPPGEPEPELRTKLRLLEPLGLEPGNPPFRTGLGAEGPGGERIAAWLDGLALPQPPPPLVGVLTAARKADHRMPESLLASVVRQAEARGARALIIWGPGEEGRASRVAEAGGVLAPPTDLEELAALLRACAVVLVSDTGPMHLSVAVGTPTVSVFTKADHLRWGHAEPPHQVVSAFGRDPEQVEREVAEAILARIAAARAAD